MSLPPHNPEEEQKAILSAVRDLLDGHYHEAEEAQDDKGKFSIGFTAIVVRGEPVKVTVKCRISKGTITDEVEQEIARQRELPLEGEPFLNSPPPPPVD